MGELLAGGAALEGGRRLSLDDLLSHAGAACAPGARVAVARRDVAGVPGREALRGGGIVTGCGWGMVVGCGVSSVASYIVVSDLDTLPTGVQHKMRSLFRTLLVLLLVLAVAELIAFSFGILFSIYVGISSTGSPTFNLKYSIWFCAITAFAFVAYFLWYFVSSSNSQQ
jgi:hypothetical protein